jgi:hypothetical protein
MPPFPCGFDSAICLAVLQFSVPMTQSWYFIFFKEETIRMNVLVESWRKNVFGLRKTMYSQKVPLIIE